MMPKVYFSTISTVFSYNFLFNFGLLNFLIILIIIIPKFLTILAFGDGIYDASDNEYNWNILRSIKEKFNYTLFEFVCGLVILRNIDQEVLNLKLCVKYAFLFLCLLLLKSFHYLSDLKVNRLIDHNSTTAVHLRQGNEAVILHIPVNRLIKNFMGIAVLITIDVTMILKFRKDLDSNYMSLIFGYEIINILPLILLTLVQFLSLIYLRVKQKQLISNGNAVLLEFGLNLIRLMLFIAYTWFFNQTLIFPLHVLPSGYKCFRLLLKKTRNLIILKRNDIIIKQLDAGLMKLDLSTDTSINPKNTSCFCLESLDSTEYGAENPDVRILCCQHSFHYDCLKGWLVKSMVCPVCRDPVHLHV